MASLERTGRHVRISDDGVGGADFGTTTMLDHEQKSKAHIVKQNHHTIRTVEIVQHHERTQLVSSIHASQVQIDQMDAIIAKQAEIYYHMAEHPPAGLSYADVRQTIQQGNSSKLDDKEIIYPLPIPPHLGQYPHAGIPKNWPRPYLTRGELKQMSAAKAAMICAEYGLQQSGDLRLRRNRIAHYIGLEAI